MRHGWRRAAEATRRTVANIQFLSTQTRSPAKLRAGIACLSAGALYAAVSANKLVSPELSKLESLTDLRAEVARMEKLLADGGDTSITTSSIKLSEALANTIQFGDADSFREIMHDYLQESHPNTNYLNAIVNLCASQGKASLLDILINEFDLKSIVMRQPEAAALVNHPLAEEIERLSAQFIHGVGSIKRDGAQAKIAHYKAKALEEDLDAIEQPDVTGLDPVHDMSLMLAFIKNRSQATQNTNERFEHTVALDALDTNGTHKYLKALKAKSQQSETPINSIFIACDNHFTIGQLRVSERGNKVEMIYFDSLGGLESTNPAMNVIIQDIEYIFRDASKTYFISEENTQHADKGCSVFALMQLHDLSFLDQTLAHHPQYADQNIRDIFDYVYKNPKAITAKGKEDCYRPLDANGNYEEKPIVVEWSTVLPPLTFVRAKQSFNSTGEKKAKEYGAERQVVGYMGIEKELIHSDVARQAEEHLPIDRHGKETFREWITRNTGTNQRGRPFNESTVLEIWRWGRNMTSWLVSLSPREVTALASAHTADTFAKSTETSSFLGKTRLFRQQPTHDTRRIEVLDNHDDEAITSTPSA